LRNADGCRERITVFKHRRNEPSSSSCGRRLFLGWSASSANSSLDGDARGDLRVPASSLLPPLDPSSFILSLVGEITPICTQDRFTQEQRILTPGRKDG
jgi:hypothetical protein